MGNTRHHGKKIGYIKGTFHAMGGHAEGQKLYGPNRSRKKLRRGGNNTQKNCTKKALMTQITMMMWSLI